MSTTNTHETALKSALADFQAAPPAVPAPHLTFAAVWPAAREALAVLAGLVPASLRFVVTIVTSIGDSVAFATHPGV